MLKHIRNSAKAIIIKKGRILLTKNKDDEGIFYLLPGGGQEPGETITDALIRECKEEISAEIIIGDIVFIRDYIGKNHEFAVWDGNTHQIEYMFCCQVKPGYEVKNGFNPDNAQIGVEWIDISRLKEYRIYPSVLKKNITMDGVFDKQVYLGDVN